MALNWVTKTQGDIISNQVQLLILPLEIRLIRLIGKVSCLFKENSTKINQIPNTTEEHEVTKHFCPILAQSQVIPLGSNFLFFFLKPHH